MRKRYGWIGLWLVLSTGFAAVPIDLSDFDDDGMRDMDDANKDLQPVLGAANAAIALADLDVLERTLKDTQDYFTAKGNTDDAVQISREALALVATARGQVSGGNFDAASATARDISKTCKSCHDLYKPLKK